MCCYRYEYIDDLTSDTQVTEHKETSTENTYTLTTTSEFKTSDADDIVGDGADVFVGGAINLIWGITKELHWDEENLDVTLTDDIMVTPNGFHTMYVYTAAQIENSVIPNCLAIEDSLSANLWQLYLQMNDSNKARAFPNPHHPSNLSFNAGADYTFTNENTVEDVETIEFETIVSEEFGWEIGGIIAGTGLQEGYKFRTQVTKGKSSITTNSRTNTTSFTLADDDIASDLTFNSDFFTVDIKKDPLYGTPVFNLISGASSNIGNQTPNPALV